MVTLRPAWKGVWTALSSTRYVPSGHADSAGMVQSPTAQCMTWFLGSDANTSTCGPPAQLFAHLFSMCWSFMAPATLCLCPDGYIQGQGSASGVLDQQTFTAFAVLVILADIPASNLQHGNLSACYRRSVPRVILTDRSAWEVEMKGLLCFSDVFHCSFYRRSGTADVRLAAACSKM